MRKIAVLISVLMLVSVACSSGEPPPVVMGRGDSGDVELALGSGASLERFDECGALLDYVHEEGAEAVGPYGLQGIGMGGDMAFAPGGRAVLEDSAEAGSAPAAAQATAGTGGGADSFSGTNTQVAGVDEPDIVKTDGELMVAVGQGRVHVFDVSGDTPRKLSEVDLREKGWDHQLLLDEQRLLVLTRGSGPIVGGDTPVASDVSRESIGIAPMAESTSITIVDLSDPASPRTVSTLSLEGGYLSARMVDGIARVVTRTTPMAIPFQYPIDDTPAAEAKAEDANRELIEETTVEDWLPSYVLEDDGTTSSGQLVPCDQVHHPVEFAGPGTLSVVTVDPDDPKPGNAVSILAGGDTVYASAEALYVATASWDQMQIMAAGQAPPPGDNGLTTDIHKFDISDPAASRYVGSGTVEGTLLNQFSMDELDGNLRVASTSMPTWFGGDPANGPQSESFVTVLADRGDRLEQIGRVGGLGKDERIYSVRFIGQLGYVVTFRETDPLYVVDLSDPTSPTVRGELKILGYSAYLHPIGDGLLLGVGQDATEEGRTQGTQLAVFDVSDPANPQRVHQLRVDNASSEAEYDHHAFLYWPATGLTVLPLQTYGEPELGSEGEVLGEGTFWSGAVAFDVDPGAGIDEVGRVAHMQNQQDYLGQIRRSVVVGDALYTLSEAGLMASDLDTLAERTFVAFPAFEAR